MQAQALQDHEPKQDQSHMPHQGLIHTTLARHQTAKLFHVSEQSLDGPAATLSQHKGGQIAGQVMGCQHLHIPLTVLGHDQGDSAILGQIGYHAAGPQLQAGAPLQPYPISQGRRLLELIAVINGRVGVEHPNPGQTQPVDSFSQPDRGTKHTEDNVLNRQPRLEHFHDHLGAVPAGATVGLGPPQAKGHRDAPGAHA